MSPPSFTLSILVFHLLVLAGAATATAAPKTSDADKTNEPDPKLADPPMSKGRITVWAATCLGVATLVSAGVFAVEARQEDLRAQTHPSHAFDERTQSRRAAAIGLAAVSGASFVTALVAGIVAREPEKTQPLSVGPFLTPNAGGANLLLRF